MPQTDWDAIAKKAQESTDEHFKSEILGLTKFTDDEVLHLINDTGISEKNLVEVLKNVHDCEKSNEAKAKAIGGINKGVDVLVAVANKFMI